MNSPAPDPVRIETHESVVSGYRVYARRLSPPGTPEAAVVVVHGMVVAGRGTLPLARALARRGLSVHLPDLPGFGRSAKPAHALDVAGLGRVVAAWVRDQVPGPVVLLGNSFGTQVATAAAAAGGAPGLGLVLVAPTIDARFRGRWSRRLPAGRPGGPPRGGVPGRLSRLLVDRLVPDTPVPEPVSLRRLFATEHLAAGPARALSTYRHALRDDLTRTVGAVDGPVLVVRAGQDRLVSPAWAEEVAAAAPDGRVVAVPGVGHDGQFRQPERLAGVIVDALGDRIGPRRRGAGPGHAIHPSSTP